MKLNESVIRSPKWLRNFIDYEINTGEDIKGEPSKRRAAELEKERKKILDDAEKERIDKINKETLEKARAKLKQEREKKDQERAYAEWAKKKRIEDIKLELDKIYSDLIKDFSNNPYNDKYKTPTVNGKTTFHYTFENGKVLKIIGIELFWEAYTYTLGISYLNKFIRLGNEMIEKGRNRPKTDDYYGSSSSKSKNYKSSKWKDHPKGDTYQNLKDNIKLREEQLSKMKVGSDKTALENELETAKRMKDRMNDRYKFENLQNFFNFNKIKS